MAEQTRLGIKSPKLLAAIVRMEDNLEKPLPLAEIASDVGLSARQLERLFGRHLGSTPKRHYRDLRLHRARLLLRQTGLSIVDVLLACGFTSHSHFTRCYRERFGRTPKEERAAAL
jgi:transcriptional regulator GlxA family with amidase domain